MINVVVEGEKIRPVVAKQAAKQATKITVVSVGEYTRYVRWEFDLLFMKC